MNYPLIAGLVAGSIVVWLLITAAIYYGYRHFHPPRETMATYELPPPIQATRQPSWRQSKNDIKSQTASRKSFISALASPTVATPVTATATLAAPWRKNVPDLELIRKYTIKEASTDNLA
jgi:hypothetical protein